MNEWTALIQDARRCNLLGKLAESASFAMDSIPDGPRRHLHGASMLSLRQSLSVKWEVHRLHNALSPLGERVLLLKGAAYVMGGHLAARGRMFGDIDILVARRSLGDAESRLMLDGWISAKASAYDQRYYRRWMHEIPPMAHVKRGTVLDVHHNILPLTSRRHPNAEALIERSEPIAGHGLPWIRVPCPADLLIHSATHLAHEGELDNAMRDLHDIDAMVREFSDKANFWPNVCDYARDQQLAGPVLLVLTLAKRIFETKVPDHVLTGLRQMEKVLERPLASLYLNAIPASRKEALPPWGQVLRAIIYIRSHALRMPAHLLLPHLVVKMFANLKKAEPAPAEPELR